MMRRPLSPSTPTNAGCEHCGGARLAFSEDGDPFCCHCRCIRVEVPENILDIVKQRIGQRRLLREPRYRGIEL